MDFHSLHRRDLQALCKKNRVPANMTNVAMADALQALQTVEGIDEILESSKFLSPKKAEAASPEMTLTSRRTSTRRARRTEERQASPLPRARRVSVNASEIMRLVSEGEEENRKKEGEKETIETPAASVRVYSRRRASKKGEGEEEEEAKAITETPAASHARTTRRRATRKGEDGQEDAPTGVPPTPTTRCSQRTMAIEGSRTTRGTRRQSSRKSTTVETTARRTTRAMATAKMESLDRDEEEEEEEEGEQTGVDGKNNDLDEKSEGVKELSADGEERKEGDAKETVADQSNKTKSKLMIEEEEEEEEEEGSEEQQDQRYPLPGLSDSPIRGLVSEVNPDLVPLDSLPTARDGEEEEECGGGEETIGKLDAEIDLTHKEERETELDLSLTNEIPDETKESSEILVGSAPEQDIVAAAAAGSSSSSPLAQILSPSPSLQISEAVGSPVTTSPNAEEVIGSPAKTSALVGDLIGELLDSVVKSLAKTCIDAGAPTKPSPGAGLLTGPLEAQAPDSVESVGVAYVAAERKNDAEKENTVASSVTSLTSAGAGRNEPEEVQLKAEDQKPVKVLDLKEMSLRKLKVMYKEKLIAVSKDNKDNKVVEGKRLALAELNENIL